MSAPTAPPTTTLYLDIDGCVGAEAFSRNPREETGWAGEWHVRKVGPYQLRYSVELIEALKELAALPGVTVVFASSWEDHAPEFLPVIVGLGERHWSSLDGVLGDGGESWWWKLNAIQEDARARSMDRVLWVDDELAKIPEARAAAEHLAPTALTIAPNPQHGLTRVHIQAMRQFILTP